MGEGISRTPELDKAMKTHGKYQNYAINHDKLQAEFTTPQGKKAIVPLSQGAVDESRRVVAEQRSDVREQNIRLGNRPDLDTKPKTLPFMDKEDVKNVLSNFGIGKK